MRFDFNEANILNQNLFSTNDNKKVLLNRLDNIYKNTEDRLLKRSVLSLIKKIECLSDDDVKRLLYPIIKKQFSVTAYCKVIQK